MQQMGNVVTFHDKNPIFKSEGLKMWLAEVQRYKVLGIEEEEEMMRRYKEYGDKDAYNMLVKCNQRFIYKMAKHYSKKSDVIMDLITEGNMGLLCAIEAFDMTKGFKFISYAVFWVKRYMIDYFRRESGLVSNRLPSKLTCEKRRVQEEWYNEYHDEIPLDLLVEKVNERLKHQRARVRNGVYLQDIKIKFASDVDCIANSEDSSSGMEVMDLYARDRNECERQFEKEDAEVQIRYFLDGACSSEVEKGMMMDLYGLFGRRQMCEEEVGRKYKLGERQVDYLRRKIMNRMRDISVTGVIPKKSNVSLGEICDVGVNAKKKGKDVKGGKRRVAVSSKGGVSGGKRGKAI